MRHSHSQVYGCVFSECVIVQVFWKSPLLRQSHKLSRPHPPALPPLSSWEVHHLGKHVSAWVQIVPHLPPTPPPASPAQFWEVLFNILTLTSEAWRSRLFYCALSQLSWCSSPPTAIHTPQKQRGGGHLLRAFCVPDIVPSALILNSRSENRDRGFKNMTVFPFTCGWEGLQVHMLLAVLGDPTQLGCSSVPRAATEVCTPLLRIMLLKAENKKK